jgi:hypothetical protein
MFLLQSDVSCRTQNVESLEANLFHLFAPGCADLHAHMIHLLLRLRHTNASPLHPSPAHSILTSPLAL